MPGTRRTKLVGQVLATALTVVIIDQTFKYFIKLKLEIGESIPVIKGIFYLTHTTNTGAAFGIFPQAAAFFLAVNLVVIITVLAWQLIVPSQWLIARISAGLIVGGAAGNLIDRIGVGSVTDFLDFRIWPVFNIADSCVFIGTILLAYFILLLEGKEYDGRHDLKELNE